TVATATIWYWLLNPQYGLINRVLGWVGINGPAWLYDSNWAMFAIVMMSVWMTFGTNMMIFLAGLQGIPANLYEDSKI
ncbi:sugar ABC transporter permease, partial [Listeria monocytogenes]|nr:sugar ABC transporter permease [Listeria monocytogenes]